jgi:hypothetical protein
MVNRRTKMSDNSISYVAVFDENDTHFSTGVSATTRDGALAEAKELMTLQAKAPGFEEFFKPVVVFEGETIELDPVTYDPIQ